jgi:hypothetical protein
MMKKIKQGKLKYVSFLSLMLHPSPEPMLPALAAPTPEDAKP